MTQSMDVRRSQVIERLKEAGFAPHMSDQVLGMVDAIMTGRAPLAYVLIAATEVCMVCGLDETHRHVADAVSCLADEVLLYQKPSLGDTAGAPHRPRRDTIYWTRKRRGAAEQNQA
jgi:hypothetical protein